MTDFNISERLQSSMPIIPHVTEAHKELANQALLEFDNKNFSACCTALNKLSLQRNNDPHVLHNKAVAEFYNSDCKRTDSLRRSLNQICYMCHTTPENAKNVDDVDQVPVYYNQAIILYHLHQYKTALSIADSLFHIVEPMDEELAKKVMFLLVELNLCTQQPIKAMGLLSYVEKSLSDSSRGGSHNEAMEKLDSDGKDIGEGSLSVLWKCRISQYKMRCYLMMKAFKFCKREMKYLANASNPCSAMLFGYLKSNFEYLRGNYRKAIKILTSTPQSPSITETGQSLAVMRFNNLACVHFVLGKKHMATFYTREAVVENENVLEEVGKDQPDKSSLSGRHINRMGISRRPNLIYNMGIQLLHCNKPQAAFDCLLEAVQLYHSNPRLWLRLAECCIMANKETNEDDSKLKNRMEVVHGSVGCGLHRKLILGRGFGESRNVSNSRAMPTVTLEFASLCLSNALMLIPESASKVESGSDDDLHENSNKPAAEVLVRAPPSNPMHTAEVANLRCSILCCSAYVALSLDDYVLALSFTERLLAQPKLSSAHRYLGHMYEAEALVAADRIADAIDMLDPQSVTDISTALPPPHAKPDHEKMDLKSDKDEGMENTGGSLHQWYPNDIIKARALMQYNLATAHTLRGEFQKGLLNLSESAQVIGSPLPAQMYFLRLYLDLIEGRRKMAQVIIKDHFGHTTPNRVDLQAANNDDSTLTRP